MSGKKVKVGGGGRTMITRSMAKEGKEHPLMNHLVLETVFKYCSVEDLKVARQVSPVWRDGARKRWNNSVKLRISNVSEVRQRSSDEREKEKYKRFLQMVKSDLSLETGSQGNWTTFCAQLKTLELADVTLPTIQSLRNALFRCFPNLESLTNNSVVVLEVRQLSSEPTGPVTEDQQQRNLKHLKVFIGVAELSLSWMELLSHFPSLERIDVEVFCARLAMENFFQAINRIREEEPLELNLKHICIKMTSISNQLIGPAALSTLTDRRLQLESLELCRFFDIRALREILQVHASTLKVLAFESAPVNPFSLGSGFPQLTKLQDLSMILSSSSDSIEFLKFTPNLRKLTLMSIYYRDQRVNQVNFARLPIMLNDCKSLEIWDSERSFSEEDWKSLMDWTPNLESLKVSGVDNATFAMICERWVNLKVLRVEGRSEVDGSGITGWDKEDVQRFDSMWSSKRRARAAPSGSRPITVPRANIAALKTCKWLSIPPDLQIFKMTTTSRIKLSRSAGLYGIEMLPDLRRLSIQYYEIMPEHRNYWKKLHEKYPFPKEEEDGDEEDEEEDESGEEENYEEP